MENEGLNVLGDNWMETQYKLFKNVLNEGPYVFIEAPKVWQENLKTQYFKTQTIPFMITQGIKENLFSTVSTFHSCTYACVSFLNLCQGMLGKRDWLTLTQNMLWFDNDKKIHAVIGRNYNICDIVFVDNAVDLKHVCLANYRKIVFFYAGAKSHTECKINAFTNVSLAAATHFLTNGGHEMCLRNVTSKSKCKLARFLCLVWCTPHVPRDLRQVLWSKIKREEKCCY